MAKEKFTYRYILADGSESTNTTKELKLKDMQDMVAGYIEVVAIDEKYSAIVNEDGRLKDLPVNEKFPMFVGNIIIVEMKYLN